MQDLKSGNILLNSEGEAKISDVGLANILTKSHLTANQAGFTFAWAAPEVCVVAQLQFCNMTRMDLMLTRAFPRSLTNGLRYELIPKRGLEINGYFINEIRLCSC